MSSADLPATAPWRPAAPVVMRGVHAGRVWSATPVTVVQDTPALVALWLAPGTTRLTPCAPAGGPVGVADVENGTWRRCERV